MATKILPEDFPSMERPWSLAQTGPFPVASCGEWMLVRWSRTDPKHLPQSTGLQYCCYNMNRKSALSNTWHHSPYFSAMWHRNAIDCTVFPKPISSARIPLIPYRDRKCKVLFKYTHTTNNSNLVHLQLTVTFISCVLRHGMAHTYSQNVKLANNVWP